MIDRLLTPAEAAEFLGLSRAVLALYRHEDRGPAYIRLAPNKVRYALADLVEWAERARHVPANARRGGVQ